MLKHVVEAFSQESYEEAIYKASDKASAFLSGTQSDAHVMIKSLDHSEAMGYHAVLEITLVPISLRENMDIIGAFKLARRAHDLAFRLMLKEEHEHLHHVLEDHFARVRSAAPPAPIPDFILCTATDAEVDNKLIEHVLAPHGPRPEKE